MNPAGKVRCNLWKKVKSRNDYCKLSYSMHEPFARIVFGHWRIQALGKMLLQRCAIHRSKNILEVVEHGQEQPRKTLPG